MMVTDLFWKRRKPVKLTLGEPFFGTGAYSLHSNKGCASSEGLLIFMEPAPVAAR